MLIKRRCKCCGQKVEEVIPQPLIVLSVGHGSEDKDCGIRVLEGAELYNDYPTEVRDSFYQAGSEFRKWWDGHIAGGFSDGFFGK